MTRRIVEWLPTNSLFDHRISEQIDCAVEEWGKLWLPVGTSGYSVSEFVASKWDQRWSPKEQTWDAIGAGLVQFSGENASLSLAKALVDAPESSLKPSQADKNLLSLFARDALADLAEIIVEKLGALSIPTKAEHNLTQPLKIAELKLRSVTKWLPDLHIGLPLDMLVSARKALIGSPAGKPPEPTKLVNAITDERITVMAKLGTAQIAAADLLGLEAGDVLVLDTLVTKSFPIISTKSGEAICMARLEHDDGRLHLQVAE